MTIRHDNYTPKDPSSTGRIFFRDYEDERTDASAGIGVSYPSGIVSVGLSGNEQKVVDSVSSIIPPVVGTASNPSLKLFTPDDIIAFVAAHETGGGGGGGGNTWSDPVSSNILPSLANDVAFTLGDSDQRFKEIWVSGIHTFSSIDLRGQVFENVGPTSSTLSGVSTAERNAGEETDFRLFSPADISSMALQHGPAAGSITEGALEDLIAGLDASSIQSNDEFLFRVASGTDELAVTTASGIVDKGLTDLGIDPQNRITNTRDPNANDDGVGTNGVTHIINDLWTNTSSDEAFICLDITTSAAVWSSITAAAAGGGVTDHGALTGLSDDDHTQYLLTDGTRTLTGNQDFGGNVVDNYGAASSTLSAVSTAEITAGTSTEYRVWSPADVSAAVIAHETGGGGGSLTESELHDLISGLDASSIQSNDEFLFRVSSGTDELAVTTASGIVDRGMTDLGIDPQNRISVTRDPNANDDGAGTNGVIHIINDLWTNTSTDEAFICLDITTSAAVWSSITAAGGGGGSLTESELHDVISALDASSIQSNDEFLFRVASGTDELAVTTASGIVDKGLTDLGIDPQSREVTTSDPTVDDDIDLGYSSLDLWLNENNGKFYINEVATDGSAIWREFAPSGVTAAEITAGTGTDYRLWTPADVSAAVIAHETGGGGVTDHGALTGLGDDDHSQYLLTDGTRTLTGNQDFGGNVADNYGPLSSTLSAVSTDEISAGTSTEYRVYSPADVSAMIAQHAVVPELYIEALNNREVAYTNPNQSYPQRFGTNSEWQGWKVNLTEYDEFQVRGTYESGDNSGIVIGVGVTSGNTPFNRVSTPFAIGDGQGAAYEYIHSGQLGSDAIVSGGVSFDGVSTNDYAEGSWTPLDPSVKRECGLAFMYLDGSGTTAANRTWSRVHVAFRRNPNYR